MPSAWLNILLKQRIFAIVIIRPCQRLSYIALSYEVAMAARYRIVENGIAYAIYILGHAILRARVIIGKLWQQSMAPPWRQRQKSPARRRQSKCALMASLSSSRPTEMARIKYISHLPPNMHYSRRKGAALWRHGEIQGRKEANAACLSLFASIQPSSHRAAWPSLSKIYHIAGI